MDRIPRLTYALFALITVTLGVFAIIAGEKDDSPGLQGIGLILIISLVIKVRSIWRKKRVKVR